MKLSYNYIIVVNCSSVIKRKKLVSEVKSGTTKSVRKPLVDEPGRDMPLQQVLAYRDIMPLRYFLFSVLEYSEFLLLMKDMY